MYSVPVNTSHALNRPTGQHKIAIPRLASSAQQQKATKFRQRVPRACTACRLHKIKCSGARPHCDSCARNGRDCVYILPRQDRLKILTERCKRMAELLNRLRSCATAEDNIRISHVLENFEADALTFQQSSAGLPNLDSGIDGRLGDLTAETLHGHNNFAKEQLGFLPGCLHTDDRTHIIGGIFGSSSEVQWLRAIAMKQSEESKGYARNGFQEEGSSSPDRADVSLYSFWKKDDQIDDGLQVNPYELPHAATAERLLQCYITKVHDSFPILPIKTLEERFRRCFNPRQRGGGLQLSPDWQATLNLVFAISANYSHLEQAYRQEDGNDHVLYQMRARVLHPDDATVAIDLTISRVRISGLLAFYWLSVGRVSCAWAMVSAALRYAYSLGLSDLNEESSTPAVGQESLACTWWSLHWLEQTLSTITGRPSMIIDSVRSVPSSMHATDDQIPVAQAYDYLACKESFCFTSSSQHCLCKLVDLHVARVIGPMKANLGSHFKATADLSIITHRILTSLYSAPWRIDSTAENHHDIMHLGAQLDQWELSLPKEMNFRESMNRGTQLTREHVIICFQACSARILLTRPCIGANGTFREEGIEPNFAKRMGNSCVEAAQMIVDLLPDEPSGHLIYEKGPWWCIVHHLMQAVSVLLLDLSFAWLGSQRGLVLFRYIGKVGRHLRASRDPLAQRGWNLVERLTTLLARRWSLEVSNVWQPAHRPFSIQQLVA